MEELIVVGGGPAGITAALRARELGASVTLVERGRLGGTCTNDGCVPTRVLAHAARLRRDAQQFADYGLDGALPSVDFTRLLARTHAIVERLHEKKQLLAHLEGAGVRVLAGVGAARFTDAHTLALPDGHTVRGERILLCVGGHARRLALPGAALALSHSDVWTLPALPHSLAVVGAAATGAQLASIFRAFGSEVTLLEMAPRLLPGEDEALSAEVQRAFEARGMAVRLGIAGLRRIERQGAGLRLHLEGGAPPLEVEAVLLAVGWPGNLDALNLAAAGVATERGYIAVDDAFRTNVPHIFAAGDITGRMMLVQSGSYEARIAAENAVQGHGARLAHSIVPHGGFTDPEYGAVGLTEAQARAQGEALVATVPYRDLDRAQIDGHPEGFCKLIAAAGSGRLLGAHVVGEQAVEVVQLVAAAMAAGATVGQLAALELAYPTYTAIVGLAARALLRQQQGEPPPSWRALGPRPTEWERAAG